MTLKKTYVIIFCVLISMAISRSALAYRCAYSKPPRAGCFEIIQAEGISEQEHMRIFNHRLTVAPNMKDVFGFVDPVSPPYITKDFSLSVSFDGKTYMPQEYAWRMYDIDRIAKSTWYAVRSTLTVAPADPAFLALAQVYDLEGNGGEVSVAIKIGGMFGRGGEKEWGAEPPQELEETQISFSGRSNFLRAATSEGGVYCSVNLDDLTFEDGVLKSKVVIPPHGYKYFYMICALGTEGQAQGYIDANSDPAKLNKDTYTAVQVSMMNMYNNIPYIITDNARLRRFYDKSVVSYQASRWQMPGRFRLNPFYATGGLDGRSMWSDVNEFAYAGRFLSMADPKATRKHLLFFIQAALGGKSAIDPFTAASTGPYNAFTNYSVMKLIHDYISITGDYELLDLQVGGVKIQDAMIRLVEGKASRLGKPALENYGPPENLLGDNKAKYGYFAPSPNAEKAWMFNALADLVNVAGDRDHWARVLEKKAETIAELVNSRLWNAEKGWYDTRDADAVRRTVWSAKVFDILGSGIADPWEMHQLVAHLNEKEFLYPAGLHSVSKLAPDQFDDSDIKWGGPGSFTGQAARIVEQLYTEGYSTEAEDLLGRILWWGSRFVFYPETVRADTENYDRGGRANTISGLAAAESVIFGMFGLDVSVNGEISFMPGKLTIADRVEMHNLIIRGHEFMLTLYPDRCEITMDEERLPDLEIGKRRVVVEGELYEAEYKPLWNKCYSSKGIIRGDDEEQPDESRKLGQ